VGLLEVLLEERRSWAVSSDAWPEEGLPAILSLSRLSNFMVVAPMNACE
jgi:hypothetical protein